MTSLNPFRWVRSAWLLGRIARHVENWHPVWSAYMAGQLVPELRFRNGVRLTHSSADAPLLMLFEVFADGVYRRNLHGTLEGTMIDIGANIGAASIDLAVSASGLVVQSYEPNPAPREVFCRNVELNKLTGRVQVFSQAVGRGEGTLRLWVNGPSVAATAYSPTAPFPGCHQIDVAVIGLNEVMARVTKPPVALLKVDAEGAEADIFEGADPKELIGVLNVALEYHTDLCPKADQRCRVILERAGFTCSQKATEPHRGMLYGWRK